jgi:hypothetical protein
MEHLAQLGGWLAIIVFATLWGIRIVYLIANAHFIRWTTGLDRKAWLRENGIEDLEL